LAGRTRISLLTILAILTVLTVLTVLTDLQAREHAELSAGLQPDVPEMHYQHGVVLMQQGFHEEAAIAYEQTLKLDPGHRGE
jgi:lipoprotein NlpI